MRTNTWSEIIFSTQTHVKKKHWTVGYMRETCSTRKLKRHYKNSLSNTSFRMPHNCLVKRLGDSHIFTNPTSIFMGIRWDPYRPLYGPKWAPCGHEDKRNSAFSAISDDLEIVGPYRIGCPQSDSVSYMNHPREFPWNIEFIAAEKIKSYKDEKLSLNSTMNHSYNTLHRNTDPDIIRSRTYTPNLNQL